MSLDKAGLKTMLQTMFEDLDVANTPEEKAQTLADGIDVYVKTAIATTNIPAGAVIISVSGGGGAPAVGLPNPAPIPLTGGPATIPPGGLS